MTNITQSPPGGSFLTLPIVTQPIQQKKKGGVCFLATVILVFVFVYVSYTGTILLPLLYPKFTTPGIALALLFNSLFLMVILAYTKCVMTDPGCIPRHWAFYRGDVSKRRRYCRECNAWKPDRTHHCSACSRCVLNMDHHCPWVHNCIGFYNRKFFMQLLIYGVIGLTFVFSHSLTHVILTLWTHFFSAPGLHSIADIAILTMAVILTSMSGFLCLTMAQFTAFHIRLIATNLTTIENLDSNARESVKYDLGIFRNYQQVFGPKVLLWWIPTHTASSSPVGDGVRWTTHAN